MSDPSLHQTTLINQIVIECVREDDGSLGWVWDAWPLVPNADKRPVASGAAPTLAVCLDSMRETLNV